jgi:lysophospholipase L1-like esterase
VAGKGADVANDLPRVLLAGDSISMGYGPKVRQLLDGIFQVENLPENGGNSGRLLAHVDEWMIRPNYYLIHVNCGLHDMLQGGGAPVGVPLDLYAANLERLVTRLQAETSAILIWATTTPIIDALLNTPPWTYRGTESDVLTYNEAARRVMTRHNVPINDLHRVVEEAGQERCIVPAERPQDSPGIHLTETGYNIVASEIAAFLLRFQVLP